MSLPTIMTLATAITHVVKYSGVSVICPTLDLDSLAVQLHCHALCTKVAQFCLVLECQQVDAHFVAAPASSVSPHSQTCFDEKLRHS